MRAEVQRLGPRCCRAQVHTAAKETQGCSGSEGEAAAGGVRCVSGSCTASASVQRGPQSTTHSLKSPSPKALRAMQAQFPPQRTPAPGIGWPTCRGQEGGAEASGAAPLLCGIYHYMHSAVCVMGTAQHSMEPGHGMIAPTLTALATSPPQQPLPRPTAAPATPHTATSAPSTKKGQGARALSTSVPTPAASQRVSRHSLQGRGGGRAGGLGRCCPNLAAGLGQLLQPSTIQDRNKAWGHGLACFQAPPQGLLPPPPRQQLPLQLALRGLPQAT